MPSLLSVFGIETARAADPGTWGIYCSIFGACGSGRVFLIDLATRVALFVITIIGGATVVVVIYASLRLIFSAGNDQGKEEAKKIITHALVGLVLAIMAGSLVEFVARFVQSI